MKLCPRCQATLETPLACSACGVLIPGASIKDHDPFEIFGLEVAYPIDAANLKRLLLRFTRIVHPDFFANAPAEQRVLAESASATLNSAHELLADDAARADWLVRHLRGPDELTERSMPQAFLMEVLDWNEALEAAREARAGSPERAAIERLSAELGLRRRELFESIARGLEPLPPAGSAKLVALRKELNAARYLDKTLAEIGALRVTQALSQ